MRNKIRQMMKKEEGFTLVELLAVIVILGIILAIAIPSVSGVINRAQNDANEAEKELAVEAARLYVIAEKEDVGLDEADSTHTVSIADLETKGYFEKKSKDDTLPTGSVKITRESATNDENPDTYAYEYVD